MKPKGTVRANTSWRRAANYFQKIMEEFNLRIALKDYIRAKRDSGDDAFFFAYRSIESTCRAVTGTPEDIKSKDWTKMHRKIGTTKALIDPLLEVSKDIRHGNIESRSVANARSNRDEILNI